MPQSEQTNHKQEWLTVGDGTEGTIAIVNGNAVLQKNPGERNNATGWKNFGEFYRQRFEAVPGLRLIQTVQFSSFGDSLVGCTVNSDVFNGAVTDNTNDDGYIGFYAAVDTSYIYFWDGPLPAVDGDDVTIRLSGFPLDTPLKFEMRVEDDFTISYYVNDVFICTTSTSFEGDVLRPIRTIFTQDYALRMIGPLHINHGGGNDL